jgi:hypothetical protein
VNCYLGVAHKAQVEMARAAGVVAFSHGREAAVRSLRPGDRVVYYAPKTDFDGEPLQAFVALAEVTGAAPRMREFRPGMTGWARDARFEEVREVPVRPLIDELGFVTDKRSWGMAFRGGKRAIPEADFARIASAMRAAT